MVKHSSGKDLAASRGGPKTVKQRYHKKQPPPQTGVYYPIERRVAASDGSADVLDHVYGVQLMSAPQKKPCTRGNMLASAKKGDKR
eukprot:6485827-Amphidinium_carterae.1